MEPYSADDEMIADVRRDGLSRLRIYRPGETIVVLGRGSDPEVEIDAVACIADGVPVKQRRGGGCSVLLDRGNVIVSVALPLAGFGDNDRHFRRLTAWIIPGVARAAEEVFGARPALGHDGISDIVSDDRKIGGSCIHRSKNLLFYSTTLLVDPDLQAVERYLKHPPREPAYRKGRGHSDFMGALAPGATDARIDEFAASLRPILLPAEAMRSVTM